MDPQGFSFYLWRSVAGGFERYGDYLAGRILAKYGVPGRLATGAFLSTFSNGMRADDLLVNPEKFYDFKLAEKGDAYPETGEEYVVFKAAEVGNIFPLGTRFADDFDYTYTDQQGKRKKIYMGCYGIGPSRIMGVLVEKFHDERGIVWPEPVAPFKYHLIGLDLKDQKIKKHAFEIYKLLTTNYKLEVLFDDREDVSAGEKFSDADLIGIPHRLVVSRRTGDKVEYKKRSSKEAKLVNLDEIQ